jgi:hypothetical protein
MSACFYIVVEGEDPGYDIFVNGHALARHESELEELAESLKVAPLLDFFSADRNSMAMLLEQGAGNPAWSHSLPEAQWFLPREGLATVVALQGYVEQHPASFGSDTRSLADELESYRRVLEKTSRHGLRWHLAVSWQ